MHRDVKPENILLQEGEPLLADFGIAFPFLGGRAQGARITGGGFRIGTPDYMSPEQAAGGELDGRSDLYSLGVVLYEMLLGRSPFEGRTPESTLSAQVTEVPPALDALRPGLAAPLYAAIERSLAKDPERRWQGGDDLAAALEHVRSGPRSVRVSWWMVAAAVLVIGGGVLRATWPHGTAATPQAVLLADFEGPGLDAGLTRTMRELVAVALAQSRIVTVLAPDQVAAVRRAAGMADTAKLNAGPARQLAERAGVGAMVTGEILPAGAGYSLILRAVRVRDGADLVSVSERVPDANGLVGATERAAQRLRQGLGERQEDLVATRALLDVATPSFAAFRKYSDALERNRVGDPVGSNLLLHEAVALDTGFGAAWALMAVNQMDLRHLDSAAMALAEALARPGRMTDAQRYRPQADAAYAIDDDPARALRWYDLYLQEVPHSSGGRNNRALYLTMLGRWEEARGEFLRAAAEDPRGPAVALGRIDLATEPDDRMTPTGSCCTPRAKPVGGCPGGMPRRGSSWPWPAAYRSRRPRWIRCPEGGSSSERPPRGMEISSPLGAHRRDSRPWTRCIDASSGTGSSCCRPPWQGRSVAGAPPPICSASRRGPENSMVSPSTARRRCCCAGPRPGPRSPRGTARPLPLPGLGAPFARTLLQDHP